MLLNLLGQDIKRPEVEIERISEKPTLPLPGSLNEKLAALKPVLDQMYEEAPGHLRYQAAANDLILDYIMSAPGTSIATNVCCAGVGLSVSGTTVYYIPRYVGATLPSGGAPVIKAVNGKSEEQGRITDYGRMGGNFGWSKDRDLIAGALASFTHNWVGLLALFRDRAKLPQTEPWVLPNLTLAETVAPKQFVLPASYHYALLRPALLTRMFVEVSSETPLKLGFEWWDINKNSIARIDSLDVPSGDSTIRLLVYRLPVRGYFNIEPIDAPKGLTVKSVTTIPRTR
jgi:hypothetical protein